MNKLANLQPLFEGKATRTHGYGIIAGPCSAESAEQLLETAVALAAMGVGVFRAGVWKPRSRPGCFEGAGSEALQWLKEVKRRTGMAVTVEVGTPEHLRQAVEAGVDGVWIGARTVTNPFDMAAIADALSQLSGQCKDNLSVMVKNPVVPDLDLWAGAVERCYDAGIRRLGLIHRGFGYCAPGTYRNPPVWRVPIELKRLYPSLPLYCDPSHIGGNSRLVQPLAHQAIAMGFDGIMVEVHPQPASALSDASQQLTPDQFEQLLGTISPRLNNDQSAQQQLNDLRTEIDRLDAQLLEILAKRMTVARQIGKYKQQLGLPVVQPERYRQLIASLSSIGEAAGIDASFLQNLYRQIHEESVRQQSKQ